MALKRWKLIEARIKAGLSQEALAEEFQTTRVTISHWENAVTEPYPHFKRKLEDRFGIDVKLLLAKTFEPDVTAEESLAEDTSESMIRDSSLEEENEGLALPASPSTVSTPVTSCVWQPPPPAIQSYIASNPARHFWQIAHTDYSIPAEMTAAIQATIKDMNMTTGDPITRRDALCELASIPMITLGKTHTISSRRYEEMLRFCTAALEGCWELYRDSNPIGAQHAFDCVCTYVPLLETIAHDKASLRKEALDLAAQYAMLQTLLGWNCCTHPWESIDHAEHALFLSRESGSILLQLSAHTKVSWTYIRTRQYTKAWETMQKGELMLKNYQHKKHGPTLPSGVIGNFYSSYCQAQVKNGILPDRELSIAAESSPLDEPIAMVEFTIDGKFWELAWISCAKGDPEQALVWLGKLIDTETLATHQGFPLNETDRIGAINILTDALLQSKERDMGRIIRTWKIGMKGTQSFKHEVMYQEAIANFERMRGLWRNEEAIRKLTPLTSHW